MKKSKSKTRDSRINQKRFRPTILILDDDPVVTRVIGQHLKVTFPECDVSVSNKPEVIPGFNVYFIDNDFDGKHLAKDLLSQVRQLAPHALVVALSSTLTMDDLQALVNRGCNAVYSKQNPHRSEEAKEVIRQYISVLQEREEVKDTYGFLDLLHSMKALLSQWNHRLSKQLPTSKQ